MQPITIMTLLANFLDDLLMKCTTLLFAYPPTRSFLPTVSNFKPIFFSFFCFFTSSLLTLRTPAIGTKL